MIEKLKQLCFDNGHKESVVDSPIAAWNNFDSIALMRKGIPWLIARVAELEGELEVVKAANERRFNKIRMLEKRIGDQRAEVERLQSELEKVRDSKENVWEYVHKYWNKFKTENTASMAGAYMNKDEGMAYKYEIRFLSSRTKEELDELMKE